MLRVSVILSFLLGTRGLLHHVSVAAAPPRRVHILKALDPLQRIDGGLEHIVRIVRAKRLREHVLNPGGLVLQWAAGTEAEYKAIARTFVSVFPETTVWVDGSLLVGSVEPLQLRRAEFEAKLGLPGRARGLHDLGIESFDKLVTTFVAGPDELRAYVGPGPILTDDRPLTEYFLSLSRDKNPDLSSLKGDVKRYIVGE
jgi:hypothetical protein